MKILIAEDDLTSRKILERLLSKFGKCDVATTGIEAVKAFEDSLQKGEPYELICLDIMMPELDGQGVLKLVRHKEEQAGMGGLAGAKIVMTTGLDDPSSILAAFRNGCEAYVTKPIDIKKLLGKLEEFGFKV